MPDDGIRRHKGHVKLMRRGAAELQLVQSARTRRVLEFSYCPDVVGIGGRHRRERGVQLALLNSGYEVTCAACAKYVL